MPKYPGFVGGSYQSQSLNADAERSVNLYVERIESGQGKSASALYPTPGLKVFAVPTALQQVGISNVEVTRRGGISGPISTAEILDFSAVIEGPSVAVTGGGGTGSTDFFCSPAGLSSSATSHAGTVMTSQQTPAGGFGGSAVGTSICTLKFVLDVIQTPDPPNGGSVEVDYSINGGSSWIVIGTYTTDQTTNVSFIVSGLTNLSTLNVRLRTTAVWNSGLTAFTNASLFSIHASLSGGGTWATMSGGGVITDASITIPGASVLSNQLIGTGEIFGLPVNRTYLGVDVDVHITATVTTPSSNNWTIFVSLCYQGAKIGNTKSYSQAASSSALFLSFPGTGTDLWGATLTDAIVSDPTFGIIIQVQSTSTSSVAFDVQTPRITVFSKGDYYAKFQLPGGIPGGATIGTEVIAYGLTNATFLNGQALVIGDITGNFITCVFNQHPTAYPQTADTGALYNLLPSFGIFQTVDPNPFSIGASITFASLVNPADTWLNGVTALVDSLPSANSFTVKVTHADYPPTPDSGIAFIGGLVGTPAARAMFEVNGTRQFAIVVGNFYELFADGSFQSRGNIADDGLPASITANVNQLLIASGGLIYVYDLQSNIMTNVPNYSTGDPLEPISIVEYCDGYFIALIANSQKFIISSILDGTQWDPLDVAVVSVFPDNVLSMIVDHREIWLFGAKHSVAYYDSGNADFPFDVVPGSYVDQGTGSKTSPIRLDNSVMWIGEDDRGGRMAWRAQGYVPQRISTHAEEYAWSQYPTVSDAVGYGYQDQGHAFYVIYFPSANGGDGATWAYDVSTGLWHERAFWTGSKYTAHRSQNHSYCFGKHLVGDWETGVIYEMNINYYDDFGNQILRTRIGPPISNEANWMYFEYFQLDLEVGLGLGQGQGSDPLVTLQWSNDGAKTWSSEYQVSAGAQGDYRKRVMWRRLGRSRNRVFKVMMSDPIPWRIVDAYLGVA